MGWTKQVNGFVRGVVVGLASLSGIALVLFREFELNMGVGGLITAAAFYKT